MARPKKKRDFRKIVVDQYSYQWRFHHGSSNGLLEVFADDQSTARGQRLTAKWGWEDWLEPEFAAPAQREALTSGEVGGHRRASELRAAAHERAPARTIVGVHTRTRWIQYR